MYGLDDSIAERPHCETRISISRWTRVFKECQILKLWACKFDNTSMFSEAVVIRLSRSILDDDQTPLIPLLGMVHDRSVSRNRTKGVSLINTKSQEVPPGDACKKHYRRSEYEKENP